MGRIGCAYVPRFELAVRARGTPGLWEQPAASVDWAARPPRLLCLTPVAEQLGAKVGQIASRVRARLPELTCFAPDPALLAKAEREALAALSLLAPRLDSDGRGAFFLGLEGMERLWPDDKSLLARLSEIFIELGLPARFAISDTPFEAWVKAVWGREKTGTLDDVPLAELDLGEPVRELCELLGLRTAGDLVRLPPGALAVRLGAEGGRLERLCRGEAFVQWPTAQKLPRSADAVELELDLPLEGLEPLLLAFRTLLDRLLALVGAERQALIELQVQVRLDDRTEQENRFVPEAATLQTSKLLELLTLWLERRPFGAPVAFIRLIALRVGPSSQVQLSLLDRREEQVAEAREQAIAKLCAAFGENAVTRPTLQNTYRPEARLAWVPVRGVLIPAAARRSVFAPLSLCLSQIVPPEPVALLAGPRLQRSGQAAVQIVHIDGPQRLSGEWWGDSFDRTYSWFRLATGALCWVFRDEKQGRLFLQAIGD